MNYKILRTLYAVSFLFLSFYSLAQKSKPKINAVITASLFENIQEVYMNQYNPVTFKINGVKPEDVIVDVSRNCILREDSGKFYLVPLKAKLIQLYFSVVIKKKDTIAFDTISFPIKNIEPAFRIGKYLSATKIPTDTATLNNLDGITIEYPGCKLPKPAIIAYETSSNIGGKLFMCAGIGSKFTEQVRSILRLAKPGKKLYVDLKAKYFTGEIRHFTCTFIFK